MQSLPEGAEVRRGLGVPKLGGNRAKLRQLAAADSTYSRGSNLWYLPVSRKAGCVPFATSAPFFAIAAAISFSSGAPGLIGSVHIVEPAHPGQESALQNKIPPINEITFVNLALQLHPAVQPNYGNFPPTNGKRPGSTWINSRHENASRPHSHSAALEKCRSRKTAGNGYFVEAFPRRK